VPPEILDAEIELIRFQPWVNGLSLAFSGLGLPALYLTFVSLSPPEASRFYYLYLLDAIRRDRPLGQSSGLEAHRIP